MSKECDKNGGLIIECDWCGEDVMPDYVEMVRHEDGEVVKTMHMCYSCYGYGKRMQL